MVRQIGVHIFLLQTHICGKICLLFILLLTCPAPSECLCWNFGGSGASNHTEYKTILLIFEGISVFQITQFNTCLYSLWKARFSGGENHGSVRVQSLKMLFQKF